MMEANTGERLRVVVADDSPPFREGMVALLESIPELEFVGEATSAGSAEDVVFRLQPDVVLMDLDMPGGGVEATRAIAARCPHVAVLVLTMHEDEASVVEAMRAGARGYVLKGARRPELVRAIHAVADGGAVLSPGVAARMASLSDMASQTRPGGPFEDLTPREREILELIARGRTNAEIAAELVLSDKTVRNHVSNILGKLRVDGRSHAIVMAREAGMGAAQVP